MEKITLIDRIGNTDIVALELPNDNTLYLKMENQNPTGSIKDRVFKRALLEYEKLGLIKKGSILTIASSGNSAISLALIGRSLGYEVHCYMPVSTSKERRVILTLLGIKSYYISGGMSEAILAAKSEPNSFYVDQFNDETMLLAHDDTALEIASKLPDIDYFITGVGSGVTLRALGTKLKRHYPNLKVVAYEPAEARALSKREYLPHQIEGVGPNFEVKNFVEFEVGQVVQVSKDEAYEECLSLVKKGLLVGITTSASVVAARKISGSNLKMLAVAYDGYDKYLEVLNQYGQERGLFPID